MNAVEFIKQYGWNDARVCILNCAFPEDRWLMRHGELISDRDFDDLKQLVDAWGLVESLGGLQECYKHIEGEFIKVGDWNFMDIKQAIELVESVK